MLRLCASDDTFSASETQVTSFVQRDRMKEKFSMEQ